jgi:hypothetical protein
MKLLTMVGTQYVLPGALVRRVLVLGIGSSLLGALWALWRTGTEATRTLLVMSGVVFVGSLCFWAFLYVTVCVIRHAVRRSP